MPVSRRLKSRRMSYRKSRGKSRRTRKVSFIRRVRKAVLKTSETKYRLGAAENVSLYHDRGTSDAGLTASTQGAIIWNPWFLVSRGTGTGQRVADEIYPIGMSLRFAYYAAADRQAQFLRVIIATVPRASTYPGGGFSEGVTTAGNFDLMDPTGSNDTVTGMIKSGDSGVKVLYDRVFTGRTVGKSEDADQLGEQRWFKKIWIRAKKGSKLTWQTDGYLKNNPMGVWIIPYDDYGTLRSDILGVCAYTFKLYYKDP